MAVLAAALAGAAKPASGPPVQILISPDRGSVRLDRPALLAIFLMRVREWPDGTPIRVFVLPANSKVHERFARERLGIYPYVLRRTWDRLVFTGTGLAPQVVDSEREMWERIGKTPGAIGYSIASPDSKGGAQVVVMNDHAPF